MSKKITIIVAILLVGLIGFTLMQTTNPVADTSSNVVASSTPDTTGAVLATSTNSEGSVVSDEPNPNFGGDGQEDPATEPTAYTLKDVASHNSSVSCYSVVNGNVYDLTSFISRHPGGSSKILRICGKDGTASFTDQHGGQRRPEQELAGLQIGVLTK